MTPDETATALVNDHFYGAPYMSEHEKPRLAAAIAAALRAYGDARARQERARCVARLLAYKYQVQDNGALWWPIRALDDFIAAIC